MKFNEYFGQYGLILKILVVYKTSPDKTKIIRVFFDTTKYCGLFLNNIQCPNPNKCSFLHKIATDKDIIIIDNSGFSYDDHINLSKKIIQSSNLKTFLNNNNKKSTVLPPVDFIFLSDEEKQNYFTSKNIKYIKNIKASNNNIYLNDFNGQLNNFDFNYISSNLNNNILSNKTEKKNLNENLNLSSNINKNDKSSNTFRININNIPMESYELHNIFKKSI